MQGAVFPFSGEMARYPNPITTGTDLISLMQLTASAIILAEIQEATF